MNTIYSKIVTFIFIITIPALHTQSNPGDNDQNCSVSKPSGIKEINPVRDFLLNLKQKRKSNESTFKSRETYKRNTT